MSKHKITLETNPAREPLSECPDCGGSDLVFDRERGEVVCCGCGLVVREDMLDEEPEWRSFTPEEKEARTRVGMPSSPAIYDRGLSTEIGCEDHDAHGRELTAQTKIQFYKLRKLQTRTHIQDQNEKNLLQAMSLLARFSDRLAAPSSVKEQAAILYRKMLERDIVKGRSIRGLVAACLYATFRVSNLPRSLNEVSEVCGVKKKELAGCYRLIVRKLGISVPCQTFQHTF